jgi:hypothetical protein
MSRPKVQILPTKLLRIIPPQFSLSLPSLEGARMKSPWVVLFPLLSACTSQQTARYEQRTRLEQHPIIWIKPAGVSDQQLQADKRRCLGDLVCMTARGYMQTSDPETARLIGESRNTLPDH